MLNVDDVAPDFDLPSTKGKDKRFRLAETLARKPVLLAFYPFDWSPVCTNELGFLNTSLDDFKAKGVAVAAISVDSEFCHAAWAKSEGLRLPLLSDFNKDVCRGYGVLYENYEGLKGFAKRSVLLIDKSGVIRYMWVSEDPGQEPDYDSIFAAVDAL